MKKIDIASEKILLRVDENVSKELQKEWNNIEDKLNSLKAYDTTGIEPMVRISEVSSDYLREDIPGKVMDKNDVLANAKNSDDDFIIVQKVVSND